MQLKQLMENFNKVIQEGYWENTLMKPEYVGLVFSVIKDGKQIGEVAVSPDMDGFVDVNDDLVKVGKRTAGYQLRPIPLEGLSNEWQQWLGDYEINYKFQLDTDVEWATELLISGYREKTVLVYNQYSDFAIDFKRDTSKRAKKDFNFDNRSMDDRLVQLLPDNFKIFPRPDIGFVKVPARILIVILGNDFDYEEEFNIKYSRWDEPASLMLTKDNYMDFLTLIGKKVSELSKKKKEKAERRQVVKDFGTYVWKNYEVLNGEEIGETKEAQDAIAKVSPYDEIDHIYYMAKIYNENYPDKESFVKEISNYISVDTTIAYSEKSKELQTLAAEILRNIKQ